MIRILPAPGRRYGMGFCLALLLWQMSPAWAKEPAFDTSYVSGLRARIERLRTRWEEEPIPVGLGRQVFYDDAVLRSRSDHVVRWQGHPERMNGGHPILEQDRKFEAVVAHKQGVGIYCTVIREPSGRFRMWYTLATDGGAYLAHATSTDGLTWRKRGRPLQRDNFVLDRVQGPCVFYDARARGFGHRYKLATGGSPANWRTGVSFYHSRDGMRWLAYPEIKQIEDCYSDTLQSLFYDDEAGLYRVCTRIWPGGARATRQFVRPFISEGAIGRFKRDLLGRARNAKPWVAVQDVVLHKKHIYAFGMQKQGSIYIASINRYSDVSKQPGNRFFIAVSRDGLDWDMEWVESDEEFMVRGAPGSFDEIGVMHQAGPFIDVGDYHYIYYGGYKGGHDSHKFDITKIEGHWKAIGLARIRRDGLIYLENNPAEDEAGVVLTKQFINEGDQLTVNVDGTRGRIVVEVLDDQLNPFPGFGAASADPISDDAVDHLVTWSGSSDLSALRGFPIHLRFTLEGCARLYAFEFGKNEGEGGAVVSAPALEMDKRFGKESPAARVDGPTEDSGAPPGEVVVEERGESSEPVSHDDRVEEPSDEDAGEVSDEGLDEEDLDQPVPRG